MDNKKMQLLKAEWERNKTSLHIERLKRQAIESETDEEFESINNRIFMETLKLEEQGHEFLKLSHDQAECDLKREGSVQI